MIGGDRNTVLIGGVFGVNFAAIGTATISGSVGSGVVIGSGSDNVVILGGSAEIRDNDGCGVTIDADESLFLMLGGIITGNDFNGVTIDADDSEFVMLGGTIRDNGWGLRIEGADSGFVKTNAGIYRLGINLPSFGGGTIYGNDGFAAPGDYNEHGAILLLDNAPTPGTLLQLLGNSNTLAVLGN
jgi:hypothetical protein